MFTRLGLLATRRARPILLVALAFVAVAGVLGVLSFGALKSAGFYDPSSQSQRAQRLIDDRFGGQPDLVLLVHARSGSVDSPPVAQVGRDLAGRLGAERGVGDVTSYWSGGAEAAALRSRDGTSALVVAAVGDDDDLAKALIARYDHDTPTATVAAGGGAAVGLDINEQVTQGLAVAESVAIPITLVLLLFAFGSVVAALLPLAIGLVAILGALAELYVIGSLTDVSVFAINLVTAMGLALGIDYALLILNRYREELAAGRDPRAAVIRTVETAGRTIVTSSLTVAVALAALLIFPVYFLRSFAYAGIGVTVIAMVAATVLLPALLTVLGPRVNGLKVGRGRREGGESPFWRRVATGVMRRPVLAGVPVVALLVALGIPFLHVTFGTPDDRVLPASASQARQVGDALRTQFDGSDTTGPYIGLEGPGTGSAAAVGAYARQVSALGGVTRVVTGAGVYTGGRQVVPTAAALTARFSRPGAGYLTVATTLDPRSGAGQRLVREVRAVPAPPGTRRLVGGPAADLADQKHALGSRLPLAGGLIALTTFLLLFLFTGSLLLPLKALVVNVLSLTGVFGAMVWIFQEGHLSGLLGFTPGPIDSTIPPLLFCIAFGLSMDYEVFLLSRVKELHDAGVTNEEAVAGGLARTGRIVSTAAALMAVSFAAIATSNVSFIQLFGVGTAIAIVVDATLIRGVLVPAFMRLAGNANWWAPRPLRRLHARVGLAESPHPV